MMRWRICSIGGTEIQVHASVPAYLVYAGLTGHLMTILTAFASIILHETAHTVTAACLGQRPQFMEISSLGAVVRLEDEAALRPCRRMLVLMAGPAATALLCWIAMASTAKGWMMPEFGRLVFATNVCILMLNLLPVYPLDGGRIFVLLLDAFLPPHIVARVVKCIGYVTGLSLIALNLYCCCYLGGWNLSLAFAGCCMIYCAATSAKTWAMTEMRAFLERKILLERRGCLRTQVITSLHTTSLRQLVKKLPAAKYAVITCLEAGSMRQIGVVNECELIQYYLQFPHETIAACVRANPNWMEMGLN